MLKLQVETDGDTGNQTLIIVGEDFLDVDELKDVKQKVEGGGVDLKVTRTSAVLRVPLRLRAQKGAGTKAAKGKKDEQPETNDAPDQAPPTLPLTPEEAAKTA